MTSRDLRQWSRALPRKLDASLGRDIRLMNFHRAELRLLGKKEALAYMDTAIESIEEARRELVK